jgi:hypothetical protein
VLVRPSVVVVVDDLLADAEAQVDWLMHGIERFDIDSEAQSFVSRRGKERLTVCLVTPDGVDLSQTDVWPIPPKKDYPMVTAPEPDPQWHLTARLRKARQHVRIAAVMVNHPAGQLPSVAITRPAAGSVNVGIANGGGVTRIDLSLEPRPGEEQGGLGTITHHSKDGSETTMRLEANADIDAR